MWTRRPFPHPRSTNVCLAVRHFRARSSAHSTCSPAAQIHLLCLGGFKSTNRGTKNEELTTTIGFTRRYVAMATSSYTNFSGSVTSGQTYRNDDQPSRIKMIAAVCNISAYLHHGFVLLLKLLVHDAVLLHR